MQRTVYDRNVDADFAVPQTEFINDERLGLGCVPSQDLRLHCCADIDFPQLRLPLSFATDPCNESRG